MKAIIVFASFLIAFTGYAQKAKVEYVDSHWNKTSKKNAVYYIAGIKDKEGWTGPIKYHYINGQTMVEGNYVNHQKQGKWTYFNEQGVKTEENLYNNGYFEYQVRFENDQAKDTVFSFLEDMPVYGEGMTDLTNYLNSFKIPQDVKEKNLFGTVHVKFIVDKEGNVTDVSCNTSSGEVLDKIAMDHVRNMEKWKPGTKDNKPQNVQLILPITFEADK